jgi:flagellar capping protein FliD
MTEDELKEFVDNYNTLIDKAVNYLRDNKWLDKVDRYVSIKIVKTDSNGVWFELFHTMINRIEETEFLSWGEINNLE